MKKLFFWVVFCMTTCALWAQTDVTMVVSGEGKDKDEATFNALRSAIEQTYGMFVSTNTTVLNDQLVADEIVSLSSGNIKHFEYVMETTQPNGNVYVTLKTTVSVDKLTSFCESKGMTAELKGDLFAMNIKKMEFDKLAEEKAVENLCKQLDPMLSNLFDYKIVPRDPKMSDNDNVDVEYFISASANENLITFCKSMVDQLYAISLSEQEINNYLKVNNKVKYLGLHYPCAMASLPFLNMLCKKYDLQLKKTTGYGMGVLANIYLINPTLVRKLSVQSSYEKIGGERKYKSENEKIKKEISTIPISEMPTGINISFSGDLDLEVNIELPHFYLRSEKSMKIIEILFQQFLKQLYAVEISDGLHTIYPDADSMVSSFTIRGEHSEEFGNAGVYGNGYWRWDGGSPLSISSILIYKGTLHYKKEDLSKVSQISVKHKD
ncbi:MAG: hypothetical protein IKZ52_10560 [Bacteroidales bacterium]|nr:hypothetical protein [Bacteroidales bacterium]